MRQHFKLGVNRFLAILTLLTIATALALTSSCASVKVNDGTSAIEQCQSVRPDLPPWDPSMSDGCSVPDALRPLFPIDKPEIRATCVLHDAAYYYGGTKEQRLAADLMFGYNLIATGKVSADTAEQFVAGVRAGGGPSGRIPGVSWAFGGERFCYDESPSKWDVGGYK